MAIAAGTSIPGEEFAGVGGGPSPTINATRESLSTTREMIVAWNMIDSIIGACFPIAPALPAQHPTSPFVFVKTLDFTPWPEDGVGQDGSGATATYDFAKLRITYDSLPYDEADLITRSSVYSSEVIMMPVPGLRFASQPIGESFKDDSIGTPFLVDMIEHTFTYHRVAPGNESTIDTAVRNNINHVNASTFAGAAADTLLFTGANKTWKVDAKGERTFTYGMTFKERRIPLIGGGVAGWQHYPRPDAPGPEIV